MPAPSTHPHERAPRFDASQLLLVFAGGTAGTALRALIGLAPQVAGVPVTTIVINVAGAFALGALVTRLGIRGPDTGSRLRLRLGLGTGLLGGFTTYSALAVDTATLAGSGRPAVLVLYGLGSVLAGIAAAWLGASAARALPRAPR